jgi:hypothetical protein
LLTGPYIFLKTAGQLSILRHSLFPWLNQCAMQADMLLRNATATLRFLIDLVHCQAGDAASNHGKNDHATLLEYA